ncbi:type II toxin-antitoxin system RelE/ParE family toxin [Fuscibacter oryzae]|uniref:type II toxin-antitoxin system RelE/ParE family toxin n=1 Tax=Fuscibacter oryzae TaxID=2803939 RepID=UPI002E27D037|nr:type II toxin-antitoxin system RelE/ParE family toxin [Fuscibacter oryzae]
MDRIVEVTQGDFDATARQLEKIDDLIRDIAANPTSGMRLAGSLDGWLVRHGGRGHRLTSVFRADLQGDVLQIALVAFGGQDWEPLGAGPKGAEFRGCVSC